MCTRFYIEPASEIKTYIETAERSPLTPIMERMLDRKFKSSGEIRPTDMTAVIALTRHGAQTTFPMIWGYKIPNVKGPVVNARVETASNKKSFSNDWIRHRCIIPASYYFEWMHTKMPDGKNKLGDKYAIRPKESSFTYLAGLYHIEGKDSLKFPVFTILTKAPTPELKKIHNRMPLILPERLISDWLNPDCDPAPLAKEAVTEMEIRNLTQE